MSKVIRHFCDLCEMDGEEDHKAYGWYTDIDGNDWDVCRKHGKLVKEAGLKVHEYGEGA